MGKSFYPVILFTASGDRLASMGLDSAFTISSVSEFVSSIAYCPKQQDACGRCIAPFLCSYPPTTGGVHHLVVTKGREDIGIRHRDRLIPVIESCYSYHSPK